MGDENGKSYSLSLTSQVSTTNTDAASQSQLRTALLMNYGDTIIGVVFSVLIQTLEIIRYYLAMFHLSGMRWLSLQFSKHC